MLIPLNLFSDEEAVSEESEDNLQKILDILENVW